MNKQEVEIIQFLLEHKNEDLNIHQIALFLKKDYKTVHTIISRLVKTSLVDVVTFGKARKINLRNMIHPLIFEAEYNRRVELLKNKNIAVLVDSFKAMPSQLYVLLLFGSYAKKIATKNSDIDLLFIVPDLAEEKMEREIYRVADTLPLKLHINVFKETDFIAMYNSRKITVGSEAIKNNVILHSIESYYEMMQ